MARKNPAYFIWYINDLEPARKHLEWLKMIMNNRYVNIISFPGSAKTFVLERYIAWLIGLKPWLSHAIASVSQEQAKARLKAIRQIIEYNERYKNVFPNIHLDFKAGVNMQRLNVWSSKWRNPNTGIVDFNSESELSYGQYRAQISRWGDPKNSTLITGSITSSNIIGARITGVFGVDDPHDSTNSATEEQRQKVIRRITYDFGTRLTESKYGKTVIDESQMVMVATRWFETDAPGHAMSMVNEDGKPVWASMTNPIENEEGEPTIPEFWDKPNIEKVKERSGGVDSPVFQLAYMCNPVGAASGEITIDMLRRDLPLEDPEILVQRFKRLIISCDFAHSESMKSDFTVFMAIAKDDEAPFNVYILDMLRFKRSQIKDKVAKLSSFADKIFNIYGKLDYIYMEENDSQPEYQACKNDYPDLPVKQVKTKGDKQTRFDAFSPYAQQRRLFINQKMRESGHLGALWSEFTGFPGAGHDDCCDAASLPFQLEEWRPTRLKVSSMRVQLPLVV